MVRILVCFCTLLRVGGCSEIDTQEAGKGDWARVIGQGRARVGVGVSEGRASGGRVGVKKRTMRGDADTTKSPPQVQERLVLGLWPGGAGHLPQHVCLLHLPSTSSTDHPGYLSALPGSGTDEYLCLRG